MKPEQLPLVQSAWQKHYPAFPFEYTFLDAAFDAQYRKDKLMITLFNGFSLLTLLVSCLGLFGLATYSAEQRTKEIGVRKVLGASVVSIVTLLSKDILKLVLIAIVIAAPLAWYAMTQWLADFAYKITIPWWMFAVAGFVAVSIALLTVSFQSVRAALMNPVKSLRTD
ncbi:ABC transporter permease [Spirosoma telluris]|uniref:ABC transporter permease n=1 Tax=Spirosoma telluris TaxID=2183553 RepID=UPI002FC3457F